MCRLVSKSGWLARKKEGQPARVLFLADRVVLRDQAYNAFSPFAAAASDPRLLLDENARRPSLHREIYFAIYQTLWNEDNKGRRFFEKFPADFFDLIIIDEAHRSGFGAWRVPYRQEGDFVAELCGYGAAVLVLEPLELRRQVIERLTTIAGGGR